MTSRSLRDSHGSSVSPEMLEELAARNLGIIADARLDPSPRFTVITGETGTGKTLLLGAIRLLLGGIADNEMVGPWGEEAVAEGRILTGPGTEIGAARRLSRTGRSRAYIDGSIASASALDAATDGLIEIIGQHDQLRITRSSEARRLVDSLFDDEDLAALDTYSRLWNDLRTTLAAREEIGGNLPALEREIAVIRHQVNEIRAASLLPGEDEDLETALSRMRNVASLSEHASVASDAIDVARVEVGKAVSEIRKASRLDHGLADLLTMLEALESQLGDGALESSDYLNALEMDPDGLEASEARSRHVADLKRRYGPDLDDVHDYLARGIDREAELGGLLARAQDIDSDLAAATQKVDAGGVVLRERRVVAAGRLARLAEEHLRDLGFADPILRISVEPADPGPTGADQVVIRFASDSRLTPGPIAKVASGGELSRLVLALRLAGGAGDAETVVFDEIDAGVGGVTALALGAKLSELSRSRQVLCVTHLPQVAAFADRHYSVVRTENTAEVRLVEGETRLEELARMLAGLPESERGRQAAGELLSMASRQ